MNILSKFQFICQKQADKKAIIGNGVSLSYEDLWQKSLSIASTINLEGKTNECIAFHLDSKIDEVATMLGILLSGNYFLCVPKKLLSVFEKDVPSSLFISKAPFETQCTFLHYDKILKTPYLNFNHWWEGKSLDQNDFCVYNTSGSDGKPKFVLHDYISIREDTNRQIEENRITHNDIVDFIYPTSFSSSLASIFPAILSGATIAVYETNNLSIQKIPNFWKKFEVSIATLVTSTFRSLCNSYKEELKNYNSKIRFLCVGGESVLPTDIKLFKDYFDKKCTFQNAYASTEARTIAEQKFHKKDKYNEGFSPVRQKEIIIENSQIIVKSKYISKGYFKNRKLEFHQKKDGFRLLETNDIGKWNHKGELLITGRKSSWQKVNGQRISISQLENNLSSCCNQLTCSVLVKKDDNGLDFLYAFVETSESLNEAAIKKQLAEMDDSTLIPRHILSIKKFPHTENGKLDKKKLFENTPTISTNYASEYLNVTHKLIKEIWGKVLLIEDCSIGDDFFTDCGGSSLQSLIVIDELEKRLGKNISSNSMYIYRSIRQLEIFLTNSLNLTFPLIDIQKGTQIDNVTVLFIEQGFGNTYNHIFNHEELSKVNHGYFRVDLFGSNQSKCPRTFIKELINEINKYKNVVLVGHSFFGYTGALIADQSKNVIGNVLLDSSCYNPKSKSIINRNVKGNVFYFGRLIKKQIGLSKEASNFEKRVVSVVTQNKGISFLKNSLFIYSRKSAQTSLKDISLWKRKTKKLFKVYKIYGNHMDAYDSKFSAEVLREIMRFSINISKSNFKIRY